MSSSKVRRQAWTFERFMTPLFIFFVIYTFLFWATPLFEKRGKFLDFVSSLYYMGIIVTALAFGLELAARQERTEVEDARIRVADAEKGFIEIENIFRKTDPYLSRLYREMNPQNQILQNLPAPTNLDSNRETRLEVHIADIIFQQIENVLQNEKYTFQNGNSASGGTHREWVQTWRTWFKSPRLRAIWEQNKATFYNKRTQEWIDRYIIAQEEHPTLNRK